MVTAETSREISFANTEREISFADREPTREFSFANRKPKFCLFIAAIILLPGLIFILVWFTLHPFQPHCSLEKFYVPALDKDSGDIRIMNPTTISFQLRFWHGNRHKSIYYDDLNITLSYHRNSSSLPIGNVSIPEFHQRYLQIKHRDETVQTFGVPWEDARMEVSNGKTALFRVDLDTKIRYKNGLWKAGRHELKLGTDVHVNDHGTMKNSLRLSDATVHVNCIHLSIVALSVFILPMLL